MTCHGALGRGEFELRYQPQIDLDSGAIVGVEALIRLATSATGSSVGRRSSCSVADDCGLMVPIGLWVIGETCRQARAWQDAGLRPVLVAVNISAVEFWREDFVGNVQAILRASGLEPRYLELELTEDILMQDMASSVATLARVERSGSAGGCR